MGLIGKAQVITFCEERKGYIIQDGSCEWASLLECIYMDGIMLELLIIFKGKKIQNEWGRHMKNPAANLTVSENRWTDNEIGLTLFKESFEP